MTELLLCCLHRTGAPFGIVAVRNGAPFHALAVVLVLQGALKGGSPELEMKDSFNLVTHILDLAADFSGFGHSWAQLHAN